MKNLLPKTAGIVLSIALLSSLTGCQSLMSQQKGVTEPNPDMVTVQIRASNKAAKNVQVPVAPNMRLQDVVSQAKTSFRNKTAYIVRTSPKTGEQHKLTASFGKNRRISMETDYAIQPGDKVVIAEDTTSSFDRVMKSMLGRS